MQGVASLVTSGANTQSAQVNDLLDMDSLAINENKQIPASNPVTGNSGTADLLDDILGGGTQQQGGNSLGISPQQGISLGVSNNVKIPYCVKFKHLIKMNFFFI